MVSGTVVPGMDGGSVISAETGTEEKMEEGPDEVPKGTRKIQNKAVQVRPSAAAPAAQDSQILVLIFRCIETSPFSRMTPVYHNSRPV